MRPGAPETAIQVFADRSPLHLVQMEPEVVEDAGRFEGRGDQCGHDLDSTPGAYPSKTRRTPPLRRPLPLWPSSTVSGRFCVFLSRRVAPWPLSPLLFPVPYFWGVTTRGLVSGVGLLSVLVHRLYFCFFRVARDKSPPNSPKVQCPKQVIILSRSIADALTCGNTCRY
jgi:hypothetical protein